ncbi:MAG TPA: helix-turn-helix domain-containing protein, partial [Quisquiliibacterium sp.]|nr:helix-turn-helix domain-containing protein [Quisquiliibacterium sp.]
MSSAGEGAPGAPRRGARRRAVLDAAARLFNRRGLRGATLAEVAADVGLATNSITYYFRRKEDLAVACLLEAIEAVVAIADQAAQQEDPRLRAQAFLDGYLRLLADV